MTRGYRRRKQIPSAGGAARPLPPPQEERTFMATQLMFRFAERTGLTSDAPPRRYLWTDAFAVCNFLGLGHTEIALQLVHQVHRELGRFAPGDRRTGWLSGLAEPAAEEHPTIGGLRIGKPLPERGANEPLDPDLEWDRDGQYFHYLTKWMHALDQVARATDQTHFHVWARELAATAHRAFTYGRPGARRMVWKLSIDLSRPLVPSMGHHDPLDGEITCTRLESTANQFAMARRPDLSAAIADFDEMIDRDALATADPLGLGGLLVDAYRLAHADPANDALLESLWEAASVGLLQLTTRGDVRGPAERRLAFRELGLAIGLAAVARLFEEEDLLRACGTSARSALYQLAPYVRLREVIESFWRHADHRLVPAWVEHADINEVMLATSLAPEGFLAFRPPP